jgi:hypothetical protein
MLRAGLICVGWQPHGPDLARTAREVIRGLYTGDLRRDGLWQLVQIEEAIRFGGVEATPYDYDRARSSLELIRAAPSPDRMGAP